MSGLCVPPSDQVQDSVNFRMEFCDDESALDIVVPRMILQPIIENAYIHGISELEDGGVIILKVESDSERVYVYIMDNGKGMPQEKIEELLGDTSDDIEVKSVLSAKKGHTTGIGVDNVIKRLRLYFNKYDVIDIKCEDGFTKVIFKLPRKKESV